MAFLNIVSLVKHIDKLKLLSSDQNLDVLCLNETRLDYSISDSFVNLIQERPQL